MQNGWYTGATLRHAETGTARPICNPSSEAPHQFRPRTAGPLIQRSKMEQGCPSIDTHQEWSEHSAIGSGFQNLSRAISKAMGKTQKRRKRKNAKKELVVFFAIACWAMALTVWSLNRRLVHMDIRSFLVFWVLTAAFRGFFVVVPFCSSEIC